jgi:pimeloyl-ACP methyl ester carboxylesterase
VVYDMRGAGLSERNRTVFTLESELQDLETIIDHLKLNSLILFGRGAYGPVAIAYTARYPERVTHLIFYASYAYYGKYISDEFVASILTLLRQPDNWVGGRAVNSLAGPQADSIYMDRMIKFMRDSATPDILAQILEMVYKFDVTDLCPRIKTPTLIMHRKGLD